MLFFCLFIENYITIQFLNRNFIGASSTPPPPPPHPPPPPPSLPPSPPSSPPLPPPPPPPPPHPPPPPPPPPPCVMNTNIDYETGSGFHHIASHEFGLAQRQQANLSCRAYFLSRFLGSGCRWSKYRGQFLVAIFLLDTSSDYPTYVTFLINTSVPEFRFPLGFSNSINPIRGCSYVSRPNSAIPGPTFAGGDTPPHPFLVCGSCWSLFSRNMFGSEKLFNQSHRYQDFH